MNNSTTILEKIHKQSGTNYYPSTDSVLKALELCPLEKTKVVVLGQDPYHGLGQAMGLAFSVPEHTPIPPSLRNIYKEITSDLGRTSTHSTGDLTEWARQGVLLLNSVLTVEPNKPGSHAGLGWEEFTDQVITQLSETQTNIVFLLWGAYAQKKGAVIDRAKHLVLETSHPSPLASYRGFIGCKHFSQTNTYLVSHHKKPINW